MGFRSRVKLLLGIRFSCQRLVQVPGHPLLTQFSAISEAERRQTTAQVLGPTWDLLPVRWILPDPALAMARIWQMRQQMQDFSLSLAPSFFCFSFLE